MFGCVYFMSRSCEKNIEKRLIRPFAAEPENLPIKGFQIKVSMRYSVTPQHAIISNSRVLTQLTNDFKLILFWHNVLHSEISP